MKHFLNFIDYKYLLIALILVFMFALIPREAPEQHYHQIVECRYAEGFKVYHLSFCHTEKAQVSGDIHRNNITAQKFFNRELQNCQPKANL